MRKLFSLTLLLSLSLFHVPAFAEDSSTDEVDKRDIAYQVQNHFYCDLKEGKTVRDVYKVRAGLMDHFASLGFTLEDYQSEIHFPIFAGKTTTVPNRIKWVGKFRDFKGEGVVMQAFIDSGYEHGIRTVMNCQSAEQWYVPETTYP